MKRTKLRLLTRAAVCTASFLGTSLAGYLHADTTWQLPAGTPGDWFNSGNWSAGLPNSSTNADIFDGGTAQITSDAATVDTLAVGNGLSETGTLDLSGGTLTAVSLQLNAGGFFNETGGTFNVDTLNNSINASNFNWTAGTLNVTNGSVEIDNSVNANLAASLTLGPSQSLSAPDEIVGWYGTGTLVQSGGTNAINGGTDHGLQVGAAGGSNGMYTLSGTGALTVNGYEIIGYFGNGTFSQTGGTNTVMAGTLNYIDIGYSAGTNGTYSLGGTGVLSNGYQEVVGVFGTGTFNQSGGTNTITGGNDLCLASNGGSTGNFTLSGGSTMVGGNAYVGGSFAGSGGKGTLTVSGSGALSVNGTLTAYDGHGSAINLNGGTITTGSINLSGNPALFNWTAGTLNVTNGNLSVGSDATLGSTLTLSSAQTLGVAGPGGTLTVSGSGTLNLNGGTINVSSAGTVNLTPSLTIDSGSSVVMSGGLVTDSADEIVGNKNTGLFNQSSGTNTCSELAVGQGVGSEGTYSLSGNGSVVMNGAGSFEYVGYSGGGTFNQTGGTNTLNSAPLVLGDVSGSNGTYAMGGGTLAAGTREYVGYDGTGNFNQSGGTNYIGGPAELDLGVSAGSIGTYTLSGGTLSVDGNAYVGGSSSGPGGTGVLTVSGNGTLNVGTLTAYNTPGSAINLSGGTLSVGTLNLSGNLSLFNWSSGTLSLGFSPSNGLVVDTVAAPNNMGSSFTLGTGQTLSAYTEYVGLSGNGTFTQSGGTNEGPLSDTQNLDLEIGAQLGSTGTYILSGGLLQTSNEDVGYNGNGTFIQSGGEHTNNNGSFGIVIGANSTGTYILSGGTLSSYVSLGEGGSGTFTQNGGTFLAKGGFDVGSYPGATGTYILTAGDLDAQVGFGAIECVGDGGSGTLIQSGGTNTIEPDPSESLLIVGDQTGSTGTYELEGGILNIQGSAYISGDPYNGAGGSGTLTVSGGQATMQLLYVYNTPGTTVNLSGGTLSVGTLNLSGNSSLLNWTGGTLSITGSNGLVIDTVATPNAGSNFSVGPNDVLNVANNEYVGYTGNGTLSQSGGSNSASELFLGFSAGSEGAYSLSGTGSLSTTSGEIVGDQGSGTFVQSAGINTLTGGPALILGSAHGANGQYTLSGTGIITANTELIGYVGDGTFIQSGGSNNVNGLALAIASGSNGVYSLSGTGSLAVIHDGYETIGYGGIGTFTQTGGTNSMTGAHGSLSLYVGDTGGSVGTYFLSGSGLLSASSESIGYQGTGTFNQTGGSNTVSVGLYVGDNVASANGTYSLSGSGVLSAKVEYVGNEGSGTFNQSGGTNTVGPRVNVDGNLLVGYAVGSTGSYTLSAGSLSAASEYIGNGGSGIFNQSGGTNTIVSSGYGLVLGYGVGSGTYSISGGTLSLEATDGIYVGIAPGAATGVFNISGGQVTCADTLSVFNRAGDSLNISGGTLSVGGLYLSGNSSLLNWTAGTLAITGSIANTAITVPSAGKLIFEPNTTAVTTLNSLTISPGGIVDLENNHIFIDYGNGPDPITTIAGYIKSGYNGGGWNGPGIISSTARTPTNGLLYGVGYADGADGVVAGLSFGQIEVMYTLLGDANLDGLVNGSDFNILAANFNQSITGWDQGDFNYDGLVNAADFNELAANFNQGVSGANVSTGDVAALEAFAVANGLPMPTFANVPEPASAAMMVMAGLGTLRRRRRFLR
jgi:hypothetical protein